jgi:hypothetical protein
MQEYVIDKKDIAKFKRGVRKVFRRVLGVEVQFVEEPDGAIRILPAKEPHDQAEAAKR